MGYYENPEWKHREYNHAWLHAITLFTAIVVLGLACLLWTLSAQLSAVEKDMYEIRQNQYAINAMPSSAVEP